jgi:multiple sugar transport system substrate-binding protein
MRFFSSFPWPRRFAAGYAFFAVALILFVPLAACGSSSSGSGGSGASSGPVTLTYWAWIPNMDKQVALFNQSHPDIHVNWVNVGAGPLEYNKLFTAIKANNTPDVAEVEFQLLPTFETTGGLLDIAPYGAASVKNDFPAWMWTQVTQGNSIYAVPQDSGPMAMFYRADIFKKYNLPVPTTWAQYAADAAKLHAANPNEYITDFPPKNPGEFAGYAWQAGAHWFSINGQSWNVSINDGPTMQVASFWQDLISKKLVKTETDFVNGWYHDLQTGTLATWLTGAWGAGIIEQNAPQSAGDWRVAPMPQWQAGGTVDGDWGGSTTVVFKDTKYPKQATEFAEWISDNEQSAEQEFVGGGAYPALLSALSSSTINSPRPFYGNQVINQVFQQSATQVNENFTWGPTMNQVYSDMGDDFANAVNGQGTLMDALNEVQQSTITFMKSQGFSVSS